MDPAKSHSSKVDYDADSAIGTDQESITETMTDYEYRYLENGRTLHQFQDSGYLLPNDEKEVSRLNVQHYMWLATLENKLFLAPLSSDIQSVLDIATGTGIWAMEFADQFPSAKVVGTDLSPIQPSLSVPPNCSFFVEDSDNDEWIHREKFDYIHNRTLASGWKDWPRYIRNCYNFLKPGGWVEMHEFTLPIRCANGHDDNPAMDWGRRMRDAAAAGGVDTERPMDLEADLKNAGFVNINKVEKRWPWNPHWPKTAAEKETGRLFALNLDLSALTMGLFTRNLGMTRTEVEVYLVAVREALLNPNLHNYVPIYVYWAQKPESVVD